jgi:membrane-associated protease RseP (regulator of RpoE activity)
MNGLRWFKKGPILLVLLAMIFLGGTAAPAQDANLPVTPAQPQDPLSMPGNVYNQTELSNLSALRDWRIAAVWDTADDMLGATLQPVGEALRTQLGIPAGQGLVVEGLQREGACAQAGLQQNDVLLSLDNVSLGAPNDLTKALKAAGDAPVPLKILRGGKSATIQVRPIYRVTLGPVAEQKTERYIGISVVGLNDAMRAQLNLPEGKGMVVSEMEKGSPAEKGGLKKYDIVLALNDKPIDSPETLQRQVQAAQDHQVTLKILRAGKPLTISVLAATRKVEVPPNPDGAYRFLFLNRSAPINTIYGLANAPQYPTLVNTIQSGPGDANFLRQTLVPNGQPADMNDLRQRLEQLEKELAAVRATLDKINETLKDKK